MRRLGLDYSPLSDKKPRRGLGQPDNTGPVQVATHVNATVRLLGFGTERSETIDIAERTQPVWAWTAIQFGVGPLPAWGVGQLTHSGNSEDELVTLAFHKNHID